MASINKVIIIGHLGQDPEVRHTNNGTAVATLSIATSEQWKDKAGEKQEKTEWHRVVVWDKLAELADEYLKKGSQVYVEGSLQTRKWEKDGVERYTTEIKVAWPSGQLRFLSKADGGKQHGKPQGQQKKQDNDFDDDIPF